MAHGRDGEEGETIQQRMLQHVDSLICEVWLSNVAAVVEGMLVTMGDIYRRPAIVDGLPLSAFARDEKNCSPL
jgi:hypothetical protein